MLLATGIMLFTLCLPQGGGWCGVCRGRVIHTFRYRNGFIEKLTTKCDINVFSEYISEMLYAKVVNVEFNVMSNEEKFIYLINNYWKELRIYVEKAWDERNGSLYK